MPVEKFVSLTDAKERIALELTEKILNEEYSEGRKLDRTKILDLYAECLYAASGHRKYPGRP
jgi:hypothetical protein